MKAVAFIGTKILDRKQLQRQSEIWKFQQKKIVFTNGCFDILHQGHLDLLSQAATLGDILILGINSDASVKRLKGAERPINEESFRARMLASLFMVDAVTVFEEDTPLALIQILCPDILVKGGDYTTAQIVGSDFVTQKGGEVRIIPFVEGYSTSRLITKIRSL